MIYLSQFVLGSAQYKGAVIVHVAEEGMFLAPIFLFRPGHATLLIPWTAFRAIRTEKVLRMTGGVANISMPDKEIVNATFYDKGRANLLTSRFAKPPVVA